MLPIADVVMLVEKGQSLYRWVKDRQIESNRPAAGGPAGSKGDAAFDSSELYGWLRHLYFDVDVLAGPDGFFPTGVVPVTDEVARDPDAILGELVARPSWPVAYERSVIEAVKRRGSEIWDGDTFSLAGTTLVDGRASTIDAYLGKYFDMVSSADYLEYELLTALVHRHLPLSLDDVEARERALGIADSPRGALLAGGGVDATLAVSTLVVYRRDGDYWMMCDVRSKRVAEYGDLYHVVPSFIFQPVTAPEPHNLRVEWNVRHSIYREYLEELFAVDEVAYPSPAAVSPRYFLNEPNLVLLRDLLAAGGATLTTTGLGFNLLNHRPEILTLLLIEDESWWEAQSAPSSADPLRRIALNDEFGLGSRHESAPHLDVVTTRPLDDDRWADVVRPWTTVPPAAPALVLGAREAVRRLGRTEPAWLQPFRLDPGTSAPWAG